MSAASRPRVTGPDVWEEGRVRPGRREVEPWEWRAGVNPQEACMMEVAYSVGWRLVVEDDGGYRFVARRVGLPDLVFSEEAAGALTAEELRRYLLGVSGSRIGGVGVQVEPNNGGARILLHCSCGRHSYSEVPYQMLQGARDVLVLEESHFSPGPPVEEPRAGRRIRRLRAAEEESDE